MAKSIVRFSFPGNITWGSTIKNDWAKILLDYLISEFEIGNGTFINIEPCLTEKHNQPPKLEDVFNSNQLIAEIICDIPESMADDEFKIRARLITLLEDKEFDFIKFHNCGPESNMSLGTNHLMELHHIN